MNLMEKTYCNIMIISIFPSGLTDPNSWLYMYTMHGELMFYTELNYL